MLPPDSPLSRPGGPDPSESLEAALATLRDPATIRSRAGRILDAVSAGESRWFRVDPARLDDVADRVAGVTRRRYPDLRVPYHSRWRHFEAGGIDRHRGLRQRLAESAADRTGQSRDGARALADLAIVSVLLDAGAGPDWRYREAATGTTCGRSEGLALASLAGFEAGLFSSRPDRPLQVDAAALRRLTEADLAALFQVGPDNPLVGLAGRTRLLNALGAALADQPAYFGADGRPGGLVDALAPVAPTASASEPAAPPGIEAAAILDLLLRSLNRIWPSGQALAGRPLGDCWKHRFATAAGQTGPDAGWIPFHKLSQWLTYSLLEPFEWSGIPVRGLDALTGLPEYRNGGLLIDGGVLALCDPATASIPQPVGAECVVEWRALTVALLDQVATRVRERLHRPGVAPLPLAAILEGGTWAAGRELAAERRDGAPPLAIDSDGTVF